MISVKRVSDKIHIAVADSGAGISEDFLPFVFERFRQEDHSNTRQHGGLGLGLAIVRHLVELHGGTVHVESEGKGEGSTFLVSLPVVVAQIGPNDPASESGHALLTSAQDPSQSVSRRPVLENRRILVVDDQPDSRNMAATLLRHAGAEVDTCESAEQALEALSNARYDLFVCDVAMPGEDGLTLLRRVRSSLASFAKLPAIALTAYARDVDREETHRAGFQAHLAKPVRPAELLKAISEVLLGTHRDQSFLK